MNSRQPALATSSPSCTVSTMKMVTWNMGCGSARTGYRKHHEPVVFEAAIDLGFRERVLDQAFGRNR